MKVRLVDYITNPNGEPQPIERHVSASDKAGRLYRGQGNIFSLEDEPDDSSIIFLLFYLLIIYNKKHLTIQ